MADDFELVREQTLKVADLACEIAEKLCAAAGGAGGLTKKEAFDVALGLAREAFYVLNSRLANAVPFPLPEQQHPVEQPAVEKFTSELVAKSEVEAALVVPPSEDE